MRLHQHKESRTGYGTTFVGLRNPMLHFALATGFLALHPAMTGYALDDGVRPATVSVALAGRIKEVVHNIALPSSARNARKSIRGYIPTKVKHRTKPSESTTTSSRTTNKTTTVSASLVALGVGTALALGRHTAQVDSSESAGGEHSGDGSNDTTGDDSGRNGLGGGSPPPSDDPNDPFGARNGVAASSKPSAGHRCNAGGSPPPPPPPPTGSSVDDDEPEPTPPTMSPLTFVVLVSYLLGERALEIRRLKELGSSSTLASATDSLNTSTLDSNVFGSVNASSPLLVEVYPTWDSLDDWVDNESVQLVSTRIAPALELAISCSPPPATVDFWDAYGAHKIPVALYQPLPSSPNVLLLHETTTCSVNGDPTPDAVSAVLPFLLPFLKGLYTFFVISFCGAAAFLLSFIIFTEFARDAEPEDMSEAEFARFRPDYDPHEIIVPFTPAVFLCTLPLNDPNPDIYLFIHIIPRTFFQTILDFFVTPEPQPKLCFLPPDRPFIIPPFDESVAFIEEVEEADIVDDALAVVIFEPRLPVVDVERLNVDAPLPGLNPLAPAFVPAVHRVKLNPIPVFEAINRGRRRPRPH